MRMYRQMQNKKVSVQMMTTAEGRTGGVAVVTSS